ncbi:MAG: bifunctional precorrin-2 dehydrogenase/sirohydrochlorin ferrochelatase [Deltaproteobacteria bacterium]|nr:bifunctional precorrin-2 dehydrogenase/sirohydrochlorin ferrochelatase [Deltaproteobacteria bacterium]
MRYYPLCLDISGKRCVVIGGGNVAERKVERLLSCGARVEVVGKALTPVLAAWKGEGRIVHREADYGDFCLSGASLVIGATDDETVNGRISKDARSRGIPVNIVDSPALCDFILPSVVERGDLLIAVSTGGKSPALARKLREELGKIYGPEYAVLLEILGELREKVIAAGHSSAENRECFAAVVRSEILDDIRQKTWSKVKETIRRLTGVEMEVEPR